MNSAAPGHSRPERAPRADSEEQRFESAGGRQPALSRDRQAFRPQQPHPLHLQTGSHPHAGAHWQSFRSVALQAHFEWSHLLQEQWFFGFMTGSLFRSFSVLTLADAGPSRALHFFSHERLRTG
jgi:hypothetical protein